MNAARSLMHNRSAYCVQQTAIFLFQKCINLYFPRILRIRRQLKGRNPAYTRVCSYMYLRRTHFEGKLNEKFFGGGIGHPELDSKWDSSLWSTYARQTFADKRTSDNTVYSVSQKKSPLRTCGHFSKTDGNFSTKFYVPIVRSYLR